MCDSCLRTRVHFISLCEISNLKKKPSYGWHLRLVTSPGLERNTLSLQELDEKLEELGLVEINGQIVLLGSEEANNA